jgi:hypothetical protein
MRKLFFAALFSGLLISCQPKAVSENAEPKAQSIANAKIEKVGAIKTSEPVSPYSPTPSAVSFPEINSRVGTIEFWGEEVCFIIQNPDLKAGDKVQAVMTVSESPQEVFQAEVVEKTSCKGTGESVLEMENATEYLLKPLWLKEIDSYGPGVGVVNPIGEAKVVDGIAKMDMDGDGKDEYFRSCGGFESFLVAVWSGKPLVGKRIWYSRYYLRYDSVETCKKKDWEGIPNE